VTLYHADSLEVYKSLVSLSMPTDVELIDLIKTSFRYETDLEVAGFLGVNKDTISAIRNNRTAIGESLRLTILEKCRSLDRVLYRKAEDFLLRISAGDASIRRRSGDIQIEAQSSNSIFSVKTLRDKLLELRADQKDRWALEELVDGSTLSEDATLIDLYKAHKNISTDLELAKILGIKRNSISMVRHGRSRLGPLPRLRIYRDAFGEDTSELESALESSEALLALLKKAVASANSPRS
jgi:transcriptional regulator with XRE-family HTH domain